VSRGRRPVSVTIISTFLFAATGIAAVTSFSLFHPGTKVDAMWRLNPDASAAIAAHPAWRNVAGSGLLSLSAATAWMGVGLLRGQRSAWRATIALFILNGTGDLVAFALGPHRVKGASGLLVVGAFFYVLTRKDVRGFAAR